MSQTASDGYTIWYDLQGRGDHLILTGGFGPLQDQFDRVSPLLAGRFSVLNWSWRGAGRSDRALPAPPSRPRGPGCVR